MKFYTLLTAVLLAFAMAACEKEEELPSKDKSSPAVVQQQITEDLAEKENMSGFVEAFEGLELSSEDIEEGITIFAPTDDALESTNANNGRHMQIAVDTTGLTPEVLKDHIVKGVIEAAGLQDGDTLITLNGKQLVVTVDGDAVRVNGVLLSEKNVAINEKYVVHTVEQILSNTTPQDSTGTQNTGIIEITVWNGARWSPDKPKGEVEAGVTVALYKFREDYAQGNAAAYTSQTDAEGKATFTAIDTTKTYYIVAEKDDKSNIFYKSPQPENGVYMGFFPEGLFQTQIEIEEAAQQRNAFLGNFRWKDINNDGLINEKDLIAVPYREAKAVSSETVQIDITIGYVHNFLMSSVTSGEEALYLLELAAYPNYDGGGLAAFQKSFVRLDGILSDDVNCAEGGCLWPKLDAFAFASDNWEIYYLWDRAYAIIGLLNKLLHDEPGLTFPEKVEVMAQAKGLRAYIYLQLLTYFGDVPLNTTVFGLEEGAERIPASEVYKQIVADLQEAANALPSEWPSDKSYWLNADAAWALLAKAALWNKDYETVAEYTNRVLSSDRYELMPSVSLAFEDPGNAEIIWDFSYDNGNPKAYFFERPFCPAVRLAEVYLMNAEANFALDRLEDGINSLNKLRDRMSIMTVDGTYSIEELKEALRATWRAAMPREGNRFANLVRWGKAQEVLGPLGYQSHHALLPVPEFIINQYPNLVQNPGY